MWTLCGVAFSVFPAAVLLQVALVPTIAKIEVRSQSFSYSDIGHNHGCGNLDEAYIIKNQGHLCHMHMRDALGKKNHLALGAGELELDRYLSLAEDQKCRVVSETKTI